MIPDQKSQRIVHTEYFLIIGVSHGDFVHDSALTGFELLPIFGTAAG